MSDYLAGYKKGFVDGFLGAGVVLLVIVISMYAIYTVFA